MNSKTKLIFFILFLEGILSNYLPSQAISANQRNLLARNNSEQNFTFGKQGSPALSPCMGKKAYIPVSSLPGKCGDEVCCMPCSKIQGHDFYYCPNYRDKLLDYKNIQPNDPRQQKKI